MKTVIIDYGLSNLLSVRRAFEYCGADAAVSGDPAEVRGADLLVLPGVGAFADGMEGLRRRGLVGPILEKAAAGTPLLGICLGMQMLFDESGEFGRHEGLGLIAGTVERIPEVDADGRRQTVPHIGWSPLELSACAGGTALRSFPAGGEVYFVHSFEAKPAREQDCAAWCVYGGRRVCAAARNARGNVLGCQFHPEKSGEAGLAIVREFLSGGGEK
ncbi:MAG: imidazole glycerol phosphate synthase subunit HisH [Oscillospiraceae bacterium]|nr:imidazole glycerol phosphate synthase subunit HisH [Oscillospiraceae bacterium]